MSQQAILVEGSVAKHLWRLAYPLFISVLCTFSFLLVDMYFVSLLGHHNLVALSYTRPVIEFFSGIAIGIGIAISSVIARKVGAGQFSQARQYVGHSVWLVIGLAILITLFGFLSIHPVFSWLGADQQSIHLIHQFMLIWYMGVIFLLLNFFATSALRAHGHAKGAAAFNIIAVIINAGLDPLFIFTLHMGIAGAALAGLFARAVSLLLFVYLLFHYNLITFKKTNTGSSSLLQSWRILMNIAIPASLSNIIGPLASFWMTYWLARIAQPTVAGFGVASQIQMLAVLPLLILSACIGPVVGQNVAAGKLERARQAFRQCCWFAIIWGGLITIVLWLIAPMIVGIFSKNPLTIHVATQYLSIVSISFMAWGVIMYANASFNALGYPKRSMLLVFMRMIILFFPISYLMLRWFSYQGMFIAFALSTFIVAFVGFIWAKNTLNNTNIRY